MTPTAPVRVDLWSVSVGTSIADIPYLKSLLSADEHRRALTYRFERHQLTSIVARALLRWLLAQYTGLAARDIRFHSGPYGKPFLAPEQDTGRVHFNLSHSASRIVYALTSGGAVGVDVEAVRPLEDAWAIAQRFFTAAECEELAAIRAAEFQCGFFTLWTRKEACMKGSGEGLSADPRQVGVSLASTVSRVRLEGSHRVGAAPWYAYGLDMSEPFVGAVAIQSDHAVLRSRHFESTAAILKEFQPMDL